MAFTATIDTTVKPPILTVVCDFRPIGVDVTVLGQTVRAEALAPIELVDDSGATWQQVNPSTDGGVTTVFERA